MKIRMKNQMNKKYKTNKEIKTKTLQKRKILQSCICLFVALLVLVVIPIIVQHKSSGAAAEKNAISGTQTDKEYIDTNIDSNITTDKIDDVEQGNTDSDSDGKITSCDDMKTEASDLVDTDSTDLNSITDENNIEYNYEDNSSIDNIYYGSTDKLVYLGEFFATAYTHTGNNTATGVYPKANHTVGVDPDIIPYGTTIVVEVMGELRTYVAEDTGYLDEYQLDIFYDTYDECIQFGVRDCRVWILE